jgi:hypothetical protein
LDEKVDFQGEKKPSNFHGGEETFSQNKAGNHDLLRPILCLPSGIIQHYLTNFLGRHRLFVYVPGVKVIKFEMMGFF